MNLSLRYRARRASNETMRYRLTPLDDLRDTPVNIPINLNNNGSHSRLVQPSETTQYAGRDKNTRQVIKELEKKQAYVLVVHFLHVSDASLALKIARSSKC